MSPDERGGGSICATTPPVPQGPLGGGDIPLPPNYIVNFFLFVVAWACVGFYGLNAHGNWRRKVTVFIKLNVCGIIALSMGSWEQICGANCYEWSELLMRLIWYHVSCLIGK
jgi:hypothetical protein